MIDSVITTVVSTLYMVICVELYLFLASFIKNTERKKKQILHNKDERVQN